MVFCRGCGKEIHETAQSCPNCGAPQYNVNNRTTGKLIGFGIVWSIVIWVGLLFATGFIVGMSNPENAQEAGRKIGESMGGIYFLIAIIISTTLTVMGKLPGTTKK